MFIYLLKVNPTIANEFAAASFRFGHTLVNNQVMRMNQNGQRTDRDVFLSEIIFRPVEAYKFVFKTRIQN
jgi:peroxidase